MREQEELKNELDSVEYNDLLTCVSEIRKEIDNSRCGKSVFAKFKTKICELLNKQ